MLTSPKTAILIVGPTAVGKTGLALALGQHFETEIISADSRQCFKEMQIGTAVPSQEELEAVPHHFIQSHSIKEDMNAGIFEKLSLEFAETIFRKKDTLILCGGTGLYIKAFCDGIDHLPAIPKSIRQQIQQEYLQKGLPWLQNQMQEQDNEGFHQMEQQNPQRLMRALAVLKTSGRSIKDFHSHQKKTRPFRIIKIGLALPREQLWENIEKRGYQMMENGLLKEAQKLYPVRHLNALQTVGYREMFGFLESRYSLEEAIRKMIIHTRQYAKRQGTWFKKDPDIKWFAPREKEAIKSYIQNRLLEQHSPKQ